MLAGSIRLAQACLLELPILVTEQYPEGLGHTVRSSRTSGRSRALPKTCFSSCGSESSPQAAGLGQTGAGLRHRVRRA
jgi:hypothetical protein